jgi:hypothetical protein
VFRLLCIWRGGAAVAADIPSVLRIARSKTAVNGSAAVPAVVVVPAVTALRADLLRGVACTLYRGNATRATVRFLTSSGPVI